MRDLLREVKTMYGAANIAFQELTDRRTEEEKAIETYQDTLSMYSNEIEWPHEDDVEGLLSRINLPYQMNSTGLPETSEDLEKAQNYIFENPIDAALETHIVNSALEANININKYLE